MKIGDIVKTINDFGVCLPYPEGKVNIDTLKLLKILPQHLIKRVGRIVDSGFEIKKHKIMFFEKTKNGMITFDYCFLSDSNLIKPNKKEVVKFRELEEDFKIQEIAYKL